ncbi:ABC transporter ATP-binding protein [Bordetella sp. N]|uniref:dipeptide ABC transporter ATP-binding protein n=1 Tax=Bordetella sp. N TaxID=1746199 RepID=UPI00070F43E4|nr:ABC transporter ATP-binding protein [Bordetella sp. N]ALM83138.1 ABC transporter ATP-binding protein [Bordetella sp. N]
MLYAVTPAEILRVQNLSVSYGGNGRQVLDGVDFALARGRSVALIGESGSGKSTVAKTVLRLLPASARVLGGQVFFRGQDILALPEARVRALRGRALGFVPQDPQNALNPVRTIGAQAHEAARLLGLDDVAAEREQILEVFELVGLSDPRRVYRSYPHQLSGGMLQRVLIGLAVLPKPALLVADEPTSALDVTIQKRILDLLTDLQSRLDISLLLITHDLAIAAERADDVVVLRGGVVQESAPAARIFLAPASAYARQLQADVPALNPDRYRPAQAANAGAPALVEVRNARKSFQVDGRPVHAVDDVSFNVARGSTHALVGESGSGKTTLVRLLLGLEQPDTGALRVAGQPVHGRDDVALRTLRRDLQLVYQNPYTSLDPTWRVRRILREPLDRYGIGARGERDALVRAQLLAVGLAPDMLERRPEALSGGQRQRVAIARALILRPQVLVLDEPTSALDVSVQAGILDLLVDLQRQLGLTYLFVSHDLALVRQFADNVTVLKHGKVVEQGSVEQVFGRPRDAYTCSLLAAIPQPRPAAQAWERLPLLKIAV